jgi:hypothetical protein
MRSTHDGRVLARNADLVIETIGDPALDLLARGFARVQHHVERVMDVIGPPPLSQLLLELHFIPGNAVAHSTISMPSYATSILREFNSARSGESSTRMGLVLLI